MIIGGHYEPKVTPKNDYHTERVVNFKVVDLHHQFQNNYDAGWGHNTSQYVQFSITCGQSSGSIYGREVITSKRHVGHGKHVGNICSLSTYHLSNGKIFIIYG